MGVKQNFSYWFFIGLGISLYGMAYFFVHDIFIHQRAKFLPNKEPVFPCHQTSHKQHHKHLGKKMENVSVFCGFLLNILKCISIKNDAYTYILINFFTVIICFLASFDGRIQFNKLFGKFLVSSTIVAIPFIIWDIWFTAKGVWWFDLNYTWDLK
jgi:hypothetical protein